MSSAVLLKTHFVDLEAAISDGVWEVDGDDLELYVDAEESRTDAAEIRKEINGKESSCAVFVVNGRSDAWGVLSSNLCGGKGAEVSQVKARYLCETLREDTGGCLTVGLAFNEDLEESSLLAVSLRYPRVNPGDEGIVADGAASARTIQLQVNGAVAVEACGHVPLEVSLDATLDWANSAKDTRSITLRYFIRSPGRRGEPIEGEEVVQFYTAGTKFDRATVLYIRCTGSVRTRLAYVECLGAPIGAE